MPNSDNLVLLITLCRLSILLKTQGHIGFEALCGGYVLAQPLAPAKKDCALANL